ncbi:hypothetical protein NP603_11105 [Methylomonas sp. SURF-1]|uniref:Uncharacterized protein n=1 Tax=Methylomonas aurea TaxID=2952224 RepID=A0ABT1UHF2_9GAMM|nr:hypothetical protein [Methylomonas sp. SURF-1]MCQ8181658.1 hypothetical protein [Methylomonas sp. SURF-1]
MNRLTDYRDDEDFSLVLGGPLYQLFMRARIGSCADTLLKRRIMVISLFSWLPMLALSLLFRDQGAESIKVPFLYDIDVHVRFLLAIPLMLLAERVVHQRIAPLVKQFRQREIVPDDALPRFQAIVDSALALRNSVLIEVILLVLVFTAGHYLWSHQMVLETATWFSVAYDGQSRLSPAGYWYSYVSIPVFQFLLIRWYFRLVIWMRFLWQIARMPLSLIPTHPDRAGGLGFLGGSAAAFLPFILAQTVLVAGMIANRIFHEGASLVAFKSEIAATLVFILLTIFAPLCAFAPKLAQTKRQGLLEYGNLACRYVRDFDRKWLRTAPPPDESLVGSADIQSLADLAGSFDVVKEMRPFPFDKAMVLQTAVVALLPVSPLLLTLISLEDIVKSLLGILL